MLYIRVCEKMLYSYMMLVYIVSYSVYMYYYACMQFTGCSSQQWFPLYTFDCHSQTPKWREMRLITSVHQCMGSLHIHTCEDKHQSVCRIYTVSTL